MASIYKLADSRGRLLNLLMIIQMVGSFKMGLVAPILTLLIRRHGISIVEIGVLGIAGMLGWLIFEPLSGVISDRVNRRIMISFAIVTTSIIYLLYPYAVEFSQFLVLAFALSSLSSAFSVPTRALLTELIPSAGRGHIYGRYMAVVSGSSVVAPFIGGYVSETFGYSLPFYAAAAVGIISLAAMLLMGSIPEAEKKEHTPKASLIEVMNKDLVSIYLVRGLFFFNFPFRSGFLPILLNESTNIQATETEIGIFMTSVSLTTAASQAFLGDLIDRVGSKKIIVGACTLLAVSYLGILAASSLTLLYAIGAFQGALQAGADTSMTMYLMGLLGKGKTGLVMGLYAESENIGGIIANPTFGYVYTAYGPFSSLILVSSALLLTAGISAVKIRSSPTSS